MKKPIYLDYNATTPIDEDVANEMITFIHSHFGNPSSAYETGKFSKTAIDNARQQLAALINSSPDEIIFTSCATESNNLALQGMARANSDKGKHIISSRIEHPSIIEVCKYLNTSGFEITYLPVDNTGKISPKDLENSIRPDTILISIMHANNEVGSIQPIAELADIAKKKKILFQTDAAQSLGKIETDVTKLGIDLLSIAGHKLYAPKGIGALFIKKGTKIKNIMFGAGQEKGIRPGTENLVHIVALGKACEIAASDFDKNFDTMYSTKKRLINGLKNRLGERVKINGDIANTLPNTLSVAFDGIESHSLTSLIDQEVYISTGSACHDNSNEISPVLKAMEIDPETATNTVRISTGKYTTNEEVESAIDVIVGTIVKQSLTKLIVYKGINDTNLS